jgi:hypothetical protein
MTRLAGDLDRKSQVKDKQDAVKINMDGGGF